VTVYLSRTESPLIELPSVLGMRDLRQRVRDAIPQAAARRGTVLDLLALDPLATLRCLRVAQAPIYQLPQPIGSLNDLRDALGSLNLQRAMETPVSDVTGSGPLRTLWLHAVATAHAARSLAETSGLLEPQTAYLLGLLHDLPIWLEWLALRRDGQADCDRREVARRWHLPALIASTIQAVGAAPAARGTHPGSSPHELVLAAELMAELAGFRHPARPLAPRVDTTPLDPSAAHLQAADNLRRSVAAALAAFGLEPSAAVPESAMLPTSEDLRLFVLQQTGPPLEMVARMLECRDGASYRAITTATTAAGVRYLEYDRAFVMTWLPGQQRVWVRAKSDLSPRGLGSCTLQPSRDEADGLARSGSAREARLLRAPLHPEPGILWTLGADEALVVPIGTEFAMQSFLVLDRALSGRPVRMRTEAMPARSLAGTAAMLIENLLLRRRRQRAEKFALTDPLTRLANRGVGISLLDQQLAALERRGGCLTVLMADLDNFKKLNDSHGHLAGDRALRATAEVLRKTLRRTDTVCRYGGEEFLVVLPDTSVEDAAVLATRLFTAIEEFGAEQRLPLTVSIGIARGRTDDTVQSLLARADLALYASKSHGRNRFSVDGE
jgi:diguanylate cyclase (GGDEF)-like protein